MSARPTLPGALPGLLRSGAPVVYPGAPDVRGVVYRLHSGGCVVVVVNSGDFGRPEIVTESMDEVALDLAHPYGLVVARHFLAEREGLDPRHGVTFRREHMWDGGAWYSLVAEAHDPDDHTTRGDPTRWYASESIERLMSTEADRILPALAHGPDEAEALAIIIAAVVAGAAQEAP